MPSCTHIFVWSTHVLHMHNNIIHIVSPCVGQIKDATGTLRKQDTALPDNSALNNSCCVTLCGSDQCFK